MLAYAPFSNRAANGLRVLLDDSDRSVRIEAYESLFETADPMIIRRPIDDGARGLKFVLDLAPAKRSLIYITQTKTPRIVIFNPMTTFEPPILVRLWDNRCMFRQEEEGKPMTVYYQPPNEVKGTTFPIPAPTLASLLVLLANRPDSESDMPGLDLTYSKIVSALAQMSRDRVLPCDLEVRNNALADEIAKARARSGIEIRPLTATTLPSRTDLPAPPPADLRE
jgi:hypothetical protein